MILAHIFWPPNWVTFAGTGDNYPVDHKTRHSPLIEHSPLMWPLFPPILDGNGRHLLIGQAVLLFSLTVLEVLPEVWVMADTVELKADVVEVMELICWSEEVE